MENPNFASGSSYCIFIAMLLLYQLIDKRILYNSIELLSDCDWVEKCIRIAMRNKTVQVQNNAIYNLGNMDENNSQH